MATKSQLTEEQVGNAFNRQRSRAIDHVFGVYVFRVTEPVACDRSFSLQISEFKEAFSLFDKDGKLLSIYPLRALLDTCSTDLAHASHYPFCRRCKLNGAGAGFHIVSALII